jgi:hypothetical protein
MPGVRSASKRAVTWWIERELLDRLAAEAKRRGKGASVLGLVVEAVERELPRMEGESVSGSES